MNYLIYIEHAAENLQFFLWFKDYQKRFDALPESEKALAPEWTAAQAEAAASASQAKAAATKKTTGSDTDAHQVLKGTDFDDKPRMNVDEMPRNPFHTPPVTANSQDDKANAFNSAVAPSFNESSTWTGSEADSQGTKSHQKAAATAFESADVKWQPCMSPTP
jgi:hypothetical protein